MKLEKKKVNAVTLSPALRRMTYEAFLERNEDARAEWVDGEVVYMSPPSSRHQLLVRFLTSLLQVFAETHDLGVVLPSPFQMKTGPDLPGREPDMLFVAKEHLERLKENRVDGPADLAVEIISPESRARDRGAKFYEYEGGGVREYWLIDPVRKQAEFYVLGVDGIYRAALLDEGVFESVVLEGLRLEEAWLWQEPPPPLLSVLKIWGLI